MAIAKAISKNNELLIATMILWSLYTASGLRFILNKLNRVDYRFIWHLPFLSTSKACYSLIQNQVLMNLPITLHEFLDLNFSVLNAEHSAYFIPIYLLLAHITPTYIIYKRLCSPNQMQEPLRLLGLPVFKRLKKPFWSWPLIFSLKERPALWLISKPLGVMVLQAFFWIDQSQDYPLTWLTLGVLTSFGINIPLLAHLSEFHKRFKILLHNLPVSPNTHLMRTALRILTLIGAKSLIIIFAWPTKHSFLDLSSVILFCFALNLTAYSIKVALNYEQDRFFKHCFWAFITLFIAVLGGIPPILLGLIGILLSIFLFNAYYRLMIR